MLTNKIINKIFADAGIKKKITFQFDINLLEHLKYSDLNETWHTVGQDCNLKYKMRIFFSELIYQ